MREIKFREISKDGRITKNIKMDGSLSQYTGLKDKNGREIYEGDILKNTKTTEVFEVQYGDMAAFEGVDRTTAKVEGVVFGPTFFPLSGKIEIIGNIYENPELLG